MDHQNMS